MIPNLDSKFVIVYRDHIIVDNISNSGYPVYSGKTNMTFDTYESARSFLHHQIQIVIQHDDKNLCFDELECYSVQQLRIQSTKINYLSPFIEYVSDIFYKGNPTPISIDSYQGIKAREALRTAVRYGFGIFGFPPDTLNELLNGGKYSTIVESVVPKHMIYNIENFMDVGIKTCNQDELGAIILTSTNEILEYIGIDRYNVSG